MSTDVVTVVRFLFGAAATLAWPVMAQEVLPRPEPPFKGVIGETYKDSAAPQSPATPLLAPRDPVSTAPPLLTPRDLVSTAKMPRGPFP